MQKDICNYSVITTMQTEIYKVELSPFLNLVVDQSMKVFKKSLTNLMPDSVYRQTFLANEDWQGIQQNFALSIMQNQVKYKEA